MTTPKFDCEELMNFIIPFAQHQIAKRGGLIPYGAFMTPEGVCEMVNASDGNEHPQPLDILALLKGIFVAGAREGRYKATGAVYETWITPAGATEKSDALTVSLNHRDGYSVKIVFPYKIENGEVTWANILAQPGEADIFNPGSPLSRG